MPSGWTFGRRLGFGFAFAASTLIVIAAFGYQSTHHLIENDRWVAHTQEVRTVTARLSSLLKDLETGQRGFIITGDEAYLESYQEALPQIERTLAALESLTTDNPEQQRRIATIRTLSAAKLAELRKSIDARHAGGIEAGVAFVDTGRGKEVMDQIRRLLVEMDGVEAALLDKRRVEAEESAQTTKDVILWGSIVGVGLIAALGIVIALNLTRQVGSAVLHMQSSSSELQAAASQQATGAKEQATAISEITTTITELLATSRQIAESAQRVALIADQTATSAGAGNTTVGRGQESVVAIRRQVDVVVAQMLELGKKSQQIGGVVDIVSELAEQTNILAINATIEAAGAGDSGKRFGVVADEIRKLADRVGSSTKEIRALIDDVRAAVNATVMSTETSSKSVDSGAARFTEVLTAFKQIVSQVTTTTEAAREIELSTKQQASAVEQVNVAIANVAQAAKESETTTTQTFRTASELAMLSRTLLRIVQPQAASGATSSLS